MRLIETVLCFRRHTQNHRIYISELDALDGPKYGIIIKYYKGPNSCIRIDAALIRIFFILVSVFIDENMKDSSSDPDKKINMFTHLV